MGLVDREGSKEWKDIIEKWLFPDLKSSDIPVPEAHYAIGECATCACVYLLTYF